MGSSRVPIWAPTALLALYGSPWVSDPHGSPLAPMSPHMGSHGPYDPHESLWIPMDPHGPLRVSTGCPRNPPGLHRYRWDPMGPHWGHGSPSGPVAPHGPSWTPVGPHGPGILGDAPFPSGFLPLLVIGCWPSLPLPLKILPIPLTFQP